MAPLARLRSSDPAAVRTAVVLAAGILVVLGAAVAVYVHPLVAIALVVGAIAAPLVLRDIDVAFLVVIAVILLLPFAAVPLGLGFNPTFLDLAMLTLYFVASVRLAMREHSTATGLPLSPAVALFIGLLVAALIAGTVQGMPTKNQFRTFGELALAAGLFFIVGMLVRDRRGVRRVYLAIVALGTAAAAVGLAVYLLPAAEQVRLLSLLRVFDYPSGSAVLRYINDDPARLQRATGTSIDPNSFGGMLAVVTALLLPQLVTSRPLLGRGAAWLMAAILCVALLATVSRGSLLGLATAIVVIGLARDRRMLALGIACAGLVLLAARLVPWTASYVAHFAAGLAIADRATQMRMGEYKDALALIRRYPVFGVGFGDARDVDLYRGVSSLYLTIAESMGLLGLAAFLGLIGAVAARMTTTWRAMVDDELRPVLLGCLAALCAALVSGVFDHYFVTYPHAFALLWLVIGLAMCIVRIVGVGASPAAPLSI